MIEVLSQFARRSRQVRQVWKTEGHRGLGVRARRAAVKWLGPQAEALPIRSADVIAADLSNPFRPACRPLDPRKGLVVNWVMPPPAKGSGGHTTIFRIIHYLEAHGATNRVYFYDPHNSDAKFYEAIVRDYYRFEGPVGNVDDGMDDADVVMATSWPTAYAVYNARSTGKRFYFVQDFEPDFYADGALSQLAENTYRMGFHGVTAGRWLAEKLAAEFAMQTDHFDFGCDSARYPFHPSTARNGVAFYARSGAARRGVELGMMALEILAQRRPGLEIHLYGGHAGPLPFPAIDHGVLSPEKLAGLYNRCRAGLSLSFTNVSLVPHEMLSAGCIPVVNDARHNRIVLANDFVRYAAPTPHAIADELERLSMMDGFEALSAAASASVKQASWETAGATVEAIFRTAIDEEAKLAASINTEVQACAVS